MNTLVLVSPNDAPDRDWEDFNIYGSLDGVNYDLLQSWENQTFENGVQPESFPFFNDSFYTNYRLEVTKNKGDVSLTQIGEIELRGPDESLGINSFDNSTIKLYPNPAKNYIVIEIDSPNKLNAILSDLTGKTLLSKSLIHNKTKIDLSNISSGMYLVVIRDDSGKLFTNKIVID